MNKKEYYNKLTGRLKSGIQELRELKKECDKITNEINSGKYEASYVQHLYMQLTDQKNIMNKKKLDIERELSEVTETYKSIIHDENALDPNDITSDIEILKSGITLTARDIDDILKRNPNNRTMAQICIRYAKEHKIPGYDKVYYDSMDYQLGELDAINGTANTILKWYDNEKSSERMYNALLGENSEVYSWIDSE